MDSNRKLQTINVDNELQNLKEMYRKTYVSSKGWFKNKNETRKDYQDKILTKKRENFRKKLDKKLLLSNMNWNKANKQISTARSK